MNVTSGAPAADFFRYLTAKRPIDDRSLNRHVYGLLARQLAKASVTRTFNFLELGAGCGAMLTRLIEWGLLRNARYTALDAHPNFIIHTDRYLQAWADSWDYRYERTGDITRKLSRQGMEVDLELVQQSLGEFLTTAEPANRDVVLAHAFLDLVSLEITLPQIVQLAEPGGFLYFTLNFDGVTAFEPPINPALDRQIEALYHASMDERKIDAKPSGDSRTGRHLLSQLSRMKIPLQAAGSSDWVIYPPAEGYAEDEIFFLCYILGTLEIALKGHPELDPQAFEHWLEERRKQVTENQLIYVAHQMDVLAQRPGTPGRVQSTPDE
jgi:SAM-dependent methyltransferase